ncbi:leukocyte cysteine proteinase inhibitor 1-like [Ostrea edulis]|uniref:leukocyte cysteine proteinase inhibitor 1-like n=1 Tax=Ostrea edulis TaxID=37623 RepID=UPI0024AFC426|nr:leukocyte cysteine proteinase inhibitor 1-like [Ostrea edulis]
MNRLHLLVLGLLLAVITDTYCIQVPGGLGPPQFAGPREVALVKENRNAIILKMSPDMRGPFGTFKALSFRKQVVKGTNYFIKVYIAGRRPRFIHVRIYTGLNNRSRVDRVKSVHQFEPIMYF